MALITGITATTELEAVNTMLAAIGEQPITDLVAGQALTDVQMATERLRAATREVQSAPWQFNRRFFSVPPNGTLAWTDPDGTALTLNVFAAPPDLAGFEPTMGGKNGSVPLDIVIAAATIYTPTGKLIFIDRANNREGFIQAEHPRLYLDGWFFWSFEHIPETARRYITVLAARRFIAATVGSQELEGFTLKDEAQALRLLKRDQGDDNKYSMLDNPDVYRVLGNRPRYRRW